MLVKSIIYYYCKGKRVGMYTYSRVFVVWIFLFICIDCTVKVEESSIVNHGMKLQS